MSNLKNAITLNEFTALVVADIEEKLLKENKNIYTKQEILNQLQTTCIDVIEVMIKMGYATDEPIIPNPNQIISVLEYWSKSNG